MGIGGDDDGYEEERGRRFGDDHDTGSMGHGRTRTWLPDGDDDLYEGARRPPVRIGRSIITVLGVVVLLIAAIAFANRSGDEGSGSDDGKDGTRTEAQPTAPTGEQPVTGRTDGIPSGFPQTEQGAQSAAANYAVALGSADMFDPDRRNAILSTVIAPSALNAFRSSLDAAYTPASFAELGLEEDGRPPEGLTFISRTTPVGTRVTEYTPTTATVEVWCSGLLGLAGEGSTKPVTDGWYTVTMRLDWADGDWKVRERSQRSGPAPVNGDTRASGADELAEAVEQFGGFTYAR